MGNTERAVEEYENMQLENSPGGQTVNATIAGQVAEMDKQLEEETDQMLQAAQGNLPSRQQYGYKDYRRAGNALVADDEGNIKLPMQHLKPDAQQIAGRDVATGLTLNATFTDPDGMIEKSRTQYMQTNYNTKKGHDEDAIRALANAAFTVIEQQGSYGDFAATMPDTVDDRLKRSAWDAAIRSRTAEDLVEYFKADPDPDANQAPPRLETKIKPEELAYVPGFVEASRKVYEYWNGREFTGSNQELADWSQWYLSMFNWNIPMQASVTMRAANGPEPFKQALYDLMTVDENIAISWQSVARAAAAMGMDPSTYIGLGFGRLGMKVAQSGAKTALMRVLKAGLGAGIAASGEGAVYATADDYFRQRVATEAGAQEEYDPARGAMAAGIGAAGGALLGGAAGAALSEPALKFAGQQIGKARQVLAQTPLGNEIGAIGNLVDNQAKRTWEKLRTKPATVKADDMDPIMIADRKLDEIEAPVEIDYDRAKKNLMRDLKRKPTDGEPLNAPRLMRENDLMVPQFGSVTFNQWVRRNEATLSREEILKARQWYGSVRNVFNDFFGKRLGDDLMTAWLMSNQNVNPRQALMNAMRVREQVLSGAKGKQGGLSHDALTKKWKGEPVEKGLNAKLFDFIDSALGKGARTFMGNTHSGGKPVVVDVHTGRDMGLVDNTMYERLLDTYGAKKLSDMGVVQDVKPGYQVTQSFKTKHGYKAGDKVSIGKALKLAGIEKTEETTMWRGMQVKNHHMQAVEQGVLSRVNSAPSETQYEYAAKKMRGFTDEANKNKWMGIDDWEPLELQAVGWTAMARRTGSEAFDAWDSIIGNQRQLSYELDFGEGAPLANLFPQLSEMSLLEKTEVTHDVLNDVFDMAKELVQPAMAVHVTGPGAWGQWISPGRQTQVTSTKEAAIDLADAIGYLAQQTEVWVTQKIKSGRGRALEIYNPEFKNADFALDFWRRLGEADEKMAPGYGLILDANGKTEGIRIILRHGSPLPGEDKEMGLKAAEKFMTEKMAPVIQKIADDMDIDLELKKENINVIRRKNDWTGDKDGKGYLEKIAKRYGQERAEWVRNNLAPRVESSIQAAIEKQQVKNKKIENRLGK